MKLRHAAALAMMGWYLMTPPPLLPIPDKAEPQPNLHAPLSEWQRPNWVFATEQECLAKRAELRKIWWTNVTDIPPEKITARQMTWSVKNAQCIASDDSRLK